MTKVFDALTPSVCVIVSPFQALCLIGAIRNLNLDDYKVIVVNSDRFSQTKNVLQKFDIKFEVKNVGWHRWRMRWLRLTSLLPRQSKYQRLFLGDFRSETLLNFGLQQVSDSADIVYIDDGNVSIPLFQGKLTSGLSEISKNYIRLITKTRKISFLKYFYSIYSNIYNDSFVIEHNSLSILHQSKVCDSDNAVYIVGTNTPLYCANIHISEIVFVRLLDNIINEIIMKHQQSHIIYIPHGKDTSILVEDVCKERDVEYKKLDVPIELFFVDQPQPLAIYGFTSSALYNLKQMFPSSIVVNMLVVPQKKSEEYEDNKTISEYYIQSGIELLKVDI